MSNRFSGRRAVVTGAASGIGRATLRRLQSEVALAETCEGLEHADFRAVDICAGAALEAMAAFEPDVLVNAAGILHRHDVLEHPLETWDQTIDVNVKAAFRLSRDFARALIERGATGVIVNVASIEAFTAAPRHAAYTVSKSAVAMLTKSFALELAEHGVRVVAVAPGVTETGMNNDLRSDPERSKVLAEPIPMRRFARPEEQAAAIAFLASDDASYITGAILPVDGGCLTA